MSKMKVLVLVVGMLITSAVLAENKLDINGDFLLKRPPTGWGPNKPLYWDNSGKLILKTVTGLDKTALKLVSQSRKMHLYFGKKFKITKGAKLILKVMVRGKGAGVIGAYTYPGGGFIKKDIKASEDWTEFVAELSFPQKVKGICIVVGIGPGASVEFVGLTAEIKTKKKK